MEKAETCKLSALATGRASNQGSQAGCPEQLNTRPHQHAVHHRSCNPEEGGRCSRSWTNRDLLSSDRGPCDRQREF